jgi:thioesterase domain-containing protein
LLHFRAALEGFAEVELLATPDINTQCAKIYNLADIGRSLANQIACEPPELDIYLAGYSTGGVIAFEAAQCLEAMGRRPRLVVLLDSSSTPSARPRWESMLKARRLIGSPSRLARQLTVAALLGLRLPGALRRVVLAAARVCGQSWARPMRKELLLHLWRQSLAHYELKPYAGPAVLLISASPRSGVIPGDLGWGNLIPQLDIAVAQGNHWTMLEPPLLDMNMPILWRLLDK